MSSKILQFYSNSNILITGGLGFLGKLLIQKLLRTCNDIDGVYLIIRGKKGKHASERLEEELKDPVFDKLKEERPDLREKIHLIEGDLSLPELGLDNHNRTLLLNKINVIFHCAASMNMDEKLKSAVQTNIRGLYELLNLCREMPYLKSMMYVSTAYSNSSNYVIEEKFYDVPIRATTLIKIADDISESTLEDIAPGLTRNWSNNYTFSKAIAENLIRETASDLPVSLFRPSIIMPTLSDPVPGWISNVYGPVGVMLAAGLGILRVFYCDGTKKFDLIPGDLCVNALICAAWESHQKTKNNKHHPELTDISVYNYSGGPSRNITWQQLYKYTDNYKYPFKDAMWASFLILTSNYLWFKLLWFFLHIIPAYLVDGYLHIIGKRPKLLKAYQKISKFNGVLAFFSCNQWDIKHQNLNNLWNRLEETDKKLFPFDMDLINYKDYVQNVCTGLKLYLLKESLDNFETEKKYYQRLLYIHQTVKYVLVAATILMYYKIFSLILTAFYA